MDAAAIANVASPPILSARDLTGGYGDRAVLHSVSLDAAPGEMLAIVGPNGAGKSTLLRILAGSLRPWKGAVELMGAPLESYERRTLARSLAFVAQEYPVAFPFTVLEVVLMGRAPHLGAFHLESGRDLEVAHDALARLGLLELAARPIQEISGGERKRVFLARALAQEPRVAMLDEPTAHLDLRHIAEIFARLAELRSTHGLAVVATLHDLNAAAQYADRVMILKDGAAVGYGPPEEVLTEQLLQEVYETRVYVGRNPATGAVSVLPGAPIGGARDD
ncbi:MAG TPA: ABC transporter ATP-binding protein [Candidatus Binataceae bacterium]|nr:ABC transporter ATP-binding protein [Candidatus Binataceae bacterium]